MTTLPSISGSDWRDCVYNNSHPGASPALWERESLNSKLVTSLQQSARRNVGDSEVSWRKVRWSDETQILLSSHHTKCHVWHKHCRSLWTYKPHLDTWWWQHHTMGMLEGKMNATKIKRNPWRKTLPCHCVDLNPVENLWLFIHHPHTTGQSLSNFKKKNEGNSDCLDVESW